MMQCARILTLGCLALGACSASGLLDPAPIDPPLLNHSELCARQDSLVAAAGTSVTIDQTFEILARLLPGGFGGFYTGAMFLVHPERQAETRIVAEMLQQCAGLRAGGLSSVRSLRVMHGRYDWVQLTVWRSRIEIDAYGTIASTDIDESQNRLRIDVINQEAKQKILSHLGALNVPSAAVDVFVMFFPPPTGP